MIASFLRSVSTATALAASLFVAASPAARAEDDPATAATAATAGVFQPLFFDRAARPQKPVGDVASIRFLTTGDFPPFSFLDADGRLVGYHVDLARVLCEELAATCTIQMRPFDDLVAALADKRGDAVIAGLVVRAADRTRLDATEAYLTTPGRFVGRRDALVEPTPETLAGRWVSVVSGSVHESFVLDHFPKARVAAWPDETAARDALRDGRVDLHFGDAIGLAFWLDGTAARGCCDFAGGAFLEPSVFGEGLRIVVPAANQRLRRNLDYALRKAAVDGRLGELWLRWFPRNWY